MEPALMKSRVNLDTISKKRKREEENKEDKNGYIKGKQQSQSNITSSNSSSSSSPVTKKPKSDFEKKLESDRLNLESGTFRILNEQLYTQTSDKTLNQFKKTPEDFQAYHKGFQNQVGVWPENPVDDLIKIFKDKKSDQKVADFGCGEAKLAQNVKQTVYSFDFVKLNNWVTPCDIKHVPLPNKSIDVGVFCLSLMGTNYVDFLYEAARVIKPSGQLYIVEVKSRFEQQEDKFIEMLKAIGFDKTKQHDQNKMFVRFDLLRNSKAPQNKNDLKKFVLKPCVYKQR